MPARAYLISWNDNIKHSLPFSPLPFRYRCGSIGPPLCAAFGITDPWSIFWCAGDPYFHADSWTYFVDSVISVSWTHCPYFHTCEAHRTIGPKHVQFFLFYAHRCRGSRLCIKMCLRHADWIPKLALVLKIKSAAHMMDILLWPYCNKSNYTTHFIWY